VPVRAGDEIKVLFDSFSFKKKNYMDIGLTQQMDVGARIARPHDTNAGH